MNIPESNPGRQRSSLLNDMSFIRRSILFCGANGYILWMYLSDLHIMKTDRMLEIAICSAGLVLSVGWSISNRMTAYWKEYRKQFDEWNAQLKPGARYLRWFVSARHDLFRSLDIKAPLPAIAFSYIEQLIPLWICFLILSIVKPYDSDWPNFLNYLILIGSFSVLTINWFGAKLMRGALRRE